MTRFVAGLSNNFDEKMGHNPMTGFLKEIIFTRFIGHDDVESSAVWRDSSQCWICEKWDKAHLQFYVPDCLHDTHFQQVFEISQQFRENNNFIDGLLTTIPEEDLEDKEGKMLDSEGASTAT
jgi:hypothetical protein